MLLASPAAGRSETKRMDEAAVMEKYGVAPAQLIQVKGLMGDTSDNIPGVKGIGEKTALELIKRFGNIEGVYDHIDDPFIKPKQRENLLAFRADALLSRTLGTIRRDAPVPSEPGFYRISEGEPQKAAALLKDLEMSRMIDRLGLNHAALTNESRPSPASDAPLITPSALPEHPAGEWLLAPVDNPGADGWLAVQENRLCLPDETSLLMLLDNPSVSLKVFDSAPLYALALKHSQEAASLKWDAKLAAYLLDAAANRYRWEELADNYNAEYAFRCEAFPRAGALASLFSILSEKIKEQEQQELYDSIEFPLARVLAEMSHYGILVDREGIRAFGEEIAQLADEAEQSIYEKAGMRFNPNSPKQLGEVLFEKLKLPHGKKTKTGWSTDAQTLEALRHEAPIVEDILHYRTYQKLKSTYVDGLLKAIGPDGRIHTRFNQTEARTGRLSSDEPNLQNIPIRTELGSRLRAFFIAEQDCLLVDADYSQIELRILAHASGDEHMRAAFREGADIHRSTAAKILNIPEIMVSAAERSQAKAVNFGIMYGKGAFSLAGDLDVAIPEAQAFLDSYLAAFPSVDRYMKKVIETAREKGYTTTLFGRRRALPELKSSNFQLRSAGERMARNTPIQGTAADVIKLAMVKVWQRLRNEKMDSRLILTVHDELIIEAPLAEAEAAARILREEMEGCVNYSVPLTTEVKTGENWLSAH